MSSLAEIQEAIEKLTSEDRARLREWFDAQDTEETDELLAAIDQGIRSAETERTFSLEEVRGEIKKCSSRRLLLGILYGRTSRKTRILYRIKRAEINSTSSLDARQYSDFRLGFFSRCHDVNWYPFI